MIDTNELRNTGVDNDSYAQVKETEFLSMLDELDRLYEIERRNTPLTLEQIEAELVRRGFVKFHSDNDETLYRRGGDRFFVFHGDARQYYQCVAYETFLLSAVTLQLLDAVLEAK